MKPKVITDASFKQEVLQNDQPVVVDFWAEWCGPCRMIAPILEDLAVEYGDELKIAKLNVDENPQTAQAFGIRSIPTLLFFKGGKFMNRIIGYMPKDELKTYVEKLLEKKAA